MENSKKENNEKEKKILMIKSMSYSELFELLGNKNEINSLYIWEKINDMIDSNENKNTKKQIIKIINNKSDNSLYEKYFNYNNNNPYYNAFILKNIYSILRPNKINKKKAILEKLNINNINNYYSYDDKCSNLNEILGKNYFIYYLIKIYKILINDNNEIINDEEYYKKRINNLFDLFFYTIKELVKNEYLQNIYDKNNNINLEVFINSYKDIINEISNFFINDKNITKYFIDIIFKEETKFKFILFEGIILNRFSKVSEIISEFLIKLIENIKVNKDNNNADYTLKFYYYIMKKYIFILVNKVKLSLQDIPDSIDEIKNYQNNIINFFNIFENSLDYINILDKDLLKTINEYFDEEIISILYKISIKDFDLNFYELFYGGLCSLLFKMIIQINSNKSIDKFQNIQLNLKYKDNPLVNFLFNEIMFYQFIQKKDSKTNKDTEIYRFKIKSKYTANHINNLFLLLIIKDFYNKIENKDKIDESINDYLSILNSTHKLNLWSGNTKTSWQFNHKDKIKTNKFVGLRNLGNTCYMNSLFQILYNIELFRDSILKCSCKDPKNNSLYELKKLFFSLQYLDIQYYSPDSFPKNFEGNPLKINEQMDIDEFFATLMDKLESRLKGTNNENIIKYIFQGKQNDNLNFGESCPHKRTNVYNFYSIQLQIKDKKDIYESLDSLIQGETMEGDNAIFCEKCNKKFSALKNQDFNTLPRILIFVLKRFEFDYNKLTRYKINDYFEFPLELDMNRYTSDYINKKITNVNNKYSLKGVVIHSGSCEMGHYYSIIKNLDDKNEDWFLYNDSIVTKFDINNLKREAFGNKIIGNKNNLDGNKKEEGNKDNNDIKNKDVNEERNKNEKRNIDINEERNKNEKRNVDINEERNKDNNDIRNNETFIDNDDENDISFDNENEKLINVTKKDNNDNKNKNNNINNNNAIKSTNSIFTKVGKSAYLLFYEKDSKENCEKFDKIEAINPIPVRNTKFNKRISASHIGYQAQLDFANNMKSSDNSLILKSINDEMNNYYLIKKIFSTEYHQFLLGLYINLLNYYFSYDDLFVNKIKKKCQTPYNYCLNFKESLYVNKEYFTPRADNYSNLYYYLVNKKLLFFQIDDEKNRDENHNKDKILNIFKHLLIFFFNIKIRTTNKKCFGGYVDLIKFLINNFTYCCDYFLEEFCNYNIIVEYLINCPLNEIKKLIVGIINCAMINSLENFRKNEIIKIKQMSDKEEQNEIINILGGYAKKANKFNFYNIINSDNNTNSLSDNKKISNNNKIQDLTDIKSKKNDNEYLPKILNKFINNILSLINEIGNDNSPKNKFLYFVLYKFSLICSKTKKYLIEVFPMLDIMNEKINPNLSKDINSNTNINVKNFDNSNDHDILNIDNQKKIIINNNGSIYQYENYLYMLYFNLLTYENYKNYNIYSFDNENFIFKLFKEIMNKQDCYIFAHLLNVKCQNNVSRENMIINLISDILDKIDYNDNVNYKLNKTNNNNQDCDIKNYKNRNEIDPRNILLILKLFILYKDSNEEYYNNRIELGLEKLFNLLKKYNKYYNFCILIIDFIINLFSYNKELVQKYVKKYKEELNRIIKWISDNPISPKLYKIEGLFMYKDDNVNYQLISDKEKKEFDIKESNLSKERIDKLNNIINKKINEDDYQYDIDINKSEFIFLNDDEIIYNGKHGKVKEHLNEMIKIKFDTEINKENKVKDENSNEKEMKSIWIDTEDENIIIKKLIKK